MKTLIISIIIYLAEICIKLSLEWSVCRLQFTVSQILKFKVIAINQFYQLRSNFK